MPELPEVRTVKKGLEEKIINKRIENIDVLYEKIIYEMESKEFVKKLKGQSFININTSGKYIIFELNDYFLISHLRMEGKYYYFENDQKREKHEHIVFHFDDESVLIYHDVRKFGKMYLKNKDELWTTYPLNKLGKEPFEIEEKELFEKINNKNGYIKTILLDQEVIAGIGNIYADEILFLSKIHPLKKGKEITLNDCKNIIENSIKVLNKAIKLGGTTLFTYSSLGIHGKFQNELLVHSNEENCPICKEKIKKMKVNGRTTYYCANCQKEI